MRRSNLKKNNAFSLMEIVVASTILALIMLGLVNVFFAGKRWLAHTHFKMTGTQLGKYFLDPLSVNVRQSDWNSGSSDYNVSNPLYKHTWTDTAVTLDSKQYTPTYTVSNLPVSSSGTPSTQARKVKVNIVWAED